MRQEQRTNNRQSTRAQMRTGQCQRGMTKPTAAATTRMNHVTDVDADAEQLINDLAADQLHTHGGLSEPNDTSTECVSIAGTRQRCAESSGSVRPHEPSAGHVRRQAPSLPFLTAPTPLPRSNPVHPAHRRSEISVKAHSTSRRSKHEPRRQAKATQRVWQSARTNAFSALRSHVADHGAACGCVKAGGVRRTG
jgi:hypothetical protein